VVVVLVGVVVVLDTVGVISGVGVGAIVIIGVTVGCGGNDGVGNGTGVGEGVTAGVGVPAAFLAMEIVVFLLLLLFPAFALTLIMAFEFNFAFLGIFFFQLKSVCSSPPASCVPNFTNHFFPRFPPFAFFVPIISPLTDTDLFPFGDNVAFTVIVSPGEKLLCLFPSALLVQSWLIAALLA
jgi:hypothetical protein